MKKKLTEAKKQALINKAERTMGYLTDLISNAAAKGVDVGLYGQSATRALREFMNHIERQ